MRPYYTRFPLNLLLQDLGTLTGCSVAFARALTDERRHDALGACRRGSAVLAVDLVTSLPLPDLYPGPLPVTETQEEEEEFTAEEAAAEEAAHAAAMEAVIEAATERWKAVENRITGWARPNSTNAANLLDRFVQEMVEAFPDVDNLEDGLDAAISEVRSALEVYQEAEPEDREDAWGDFVSGLSDVDFSTLGEE